MDTYEFIVSFFREGGFFLYLMAAVLVIGIAIAIERYIVLTRARMGNQQVWEEMTPSLRAGNLPEAMRLAEESGSTLATLLRYGLSRARTAARRDDIEKAMEESLLEVIPQLDKRTHYLASLANIGLLLGLLGTIIGLIAAFSAISTADPAEKANLLAASISVAMNNTAGGLIVAITLLLLHMLLDARTTAIIDSLEMAALKFLNAITENAGRLAASAAADSRPARQATATPSPAALARPRPPAPARGTV